MPNPPIQPQTEGGNILTALRWRVGKGGLWGWKKKGKNEKRGREIAMEEGDEKVEREHHLPGIRTELRESQSDNPLCFHI